MISPYAVAGDGVPGEGFAVGAERLADVASDEEVGAMNPRVAAEAEEGGVGGAVESSALVAELAHPILHVLENVQFNLDDEDMKCQILKCCLGVVGDGMRGLKERERCKVERGFNREEGGGEEE